jgi:PAS domain S-box-containing protein
VTERKLAEAALRRSEAQFRTLADHLPDVVARFDRDRRHLYINPAAESATGLKPEAFAGKTNEELGMPPENTAVWKATLERVFATGADERIEFSYTGPSGKAFWESQVVAERGAGGEIESALVLSRDITGRRQAEEERAALLHALQESQVRLQTLVSNLPGMAYRCINDPNWTMTYVSEGCEAVTSYRRDELENNRTVAYADLIHPDDRDWLWAKCQASLELRTPCQNEYRIVDRHGGERWVAERASGVYADDGTLLAIDGFIQDITAARRAKIEREQIDRKMQETQKLESLGVLAGGIAHDFNNLLTAVLGNASIAKIELPPDSSVHDCLENITEASLRAADLCKQMLAYSGRGRFVVQKLNLSDLVAQTAQMLQISISKKAALRYRLEKELPPVEVDATQIRQVIMNLVINASEAIGDHDGVISLSTGVTRVDRDYLQSTLMDPDLPEGDYVFLEVADSGCGMSAETRARIFDPFFTTKFTGRGLGLAAVLGIVRGHQGAMKVASEVGRGTTFTLLFPVAAGSAEPPMADPTHSPQWRGEGTVLVVDDEEPMRITVARMMRQMGFDPVLATDGHDAVEIFRVEPTRFAFVLLDLTMPRLDGEQTFNELRRLRPDLRVVLMSGFNAQEALVRFPRNALAGFLQKPFTLDELRAVAQVATG